MTRAAKSLLVFGVYVAVLGLTLLLIPNVLLGLFGIPPTHEIWIRLNGMFIICLSFYYIQAARHDITSFIWWTVPGRAAVIVYFIAFVFLAGAPWQLLLFGLVDLVFALWTWIE